MPQQRKRKQTKLSVLDKDAENTMINSTLKDQSSFKLKMLKEEVKDKFQVASKTLNDMYMSKLNEIDFELKNILMALPKTILETKIDINSETFMNLFLNKVENMITYEEDISNTPPTVKTTTVKRRSRSASNTKTKRASRRIMQNRSTSVDVYKTPKGRVRLSSYLSGTKYTVSKPRKPESGGVSLKRILKPNEEAISTCGSPLYVAPCTLAAPHVNIPLPGGVVLNIEPEEPKGPVKVPELDTKTKHQIRILCEQLKNLC